MNFESIDKAKAYAQHFLSQVNELEKKIPKGDRIDPQSSLSASKETASIRRASMDLTRALAEMRRF